MSLTSLAILLHLAAATPNDVERYLRAGKALYERVEYRRALEELQHARDARPTADESVQIALWRGIVLAELGRKSEAATEFTTAVELDPKAELPVRVSPKIRALYQSVRAPIVARAPAAGADGGTTLPEPGADAGVTELQRPALDLTPPMLQPEMPALPPPPLPRVTHPLCPACGYVAVPTLVVAGAALALGVISAVMLDGNVTQLTTGTPGQIGKTYRDDALTQVGFTQFGFWLGGALGLVGVVLSVLGVVQVPGP